MRIVNKFDLVLIAVGIGLATGAATAQVSATATVSVTVLPAPGMSFESSRPKSEPTASFAGSFSPQQSGEVHQTGITIRSSNNLEIDFNTSDHSRRVDIQQGGTKTITPNELRGVDKVQVVYLGS